MPRVRSPGSHPTIGGLVKTLKVGDIQATEPPAQLITDDQGDQQVIESLDYECRTVDDVIARAKVDLAAWEVERSVVNCWQVGMKLKRNGETFPVKRSLWQIKVWLRRKVPKNIYAAFEAIYERMRGHEPNYKLPKLPKITDPHMLEASLVDEHFAMLAWGAETGDDYDMKIAERIYLNAVQDILVRTQGYPIEQVLFPVGNDYFHIDNAQNRTVNGTQLDADSRYGKMIELGTMAIIRAIDMLMQRAKVKVIWIPGNHDRTTSYHLVRELKAWYRNCDRIEVDAGPKVRKYEHYGATLLGFTHGDMEPHRDLPTIMASEVPKLWAETTDHVWHIGHFHKKKEMRHTAADSFGSCRVAVLPSLVSRDAWHFSSGYVGGKRAAEAYLWSKATGYTGHFSVNAR